MKNRKEFFVRNNLWILKLSMFLFYHLWLVTSILFKLKKSIFTRGAINSQKMRYMYEYFPHLELFSRGSPLGWPPNILGLRQPTHKDPFSAKKIANFTDFRRDDLLNMLKWTVVPKTTKIKKRLFFCFK